jgi:hypothetical protein
MCEGYPIKQRGPGRVWGKVKLLLARSRVVWIVGYVVDPGNPTVLAHGVSLTTLYNAKGLRSGEQLT